MRIGQVGTGRRLTARSASPVQSACRALDSPWPVDTDPTLDFCRANPTYGEVMDGRITTDHQNLEAALASLRRLSGTCRVRLERVQENLGELRRNARAHGARRADRKPSADEAKYRLGSVLFALNPEPLDELALLGLLAHGDLALRWLANARSEALAETLLDYIAGILRDPERGEWCRQWGRRIWWERSRALYEAELQSFIASGKADDPKARWRSRHPTKEQLYLIATICTLLEIEAPSDLTRGEAFEWIRSQGGNPRFQQGPDRPPVWTNAGTGDQVVPNAGVRAHG